MFSDGDNVPLGGSVEGASDGVTAAGVEVEFGGFERGVPHLLLNGSEIDAVSEQSGGERMAQRVRVDALGDL